ncbi:MFS transporter [Conexibacter sp. DBS9H8]|uniref:MFS transporter n=1 Tax=Conexibacter sp. DBS9H8 TaxID=2937801 RepID=UPI00200E0F4D|nr:MFS transporter [Conexibacter sp. DBS9H8]
MSATRATGIDMHEDVPAVRVGRGRWGTLAAVCLAQLVLMLDVTVVIVALPSVAGYLGGSLSSLQLIIDGYALTLAALLLNVGALADRIGHRRVFLAGLAWFGAASALCGAAPSATLLVAARALQGIAAAMLFSTGLAMLGAAYTGTDRAKALGAFGAVFGAAVALGPLVGGAILEIGSWRWIFYANLPVIAVAIGITIRYASESTDPNPRGLDLPGQVAFTVAIAALVTALIKGPDWGWSSPVTLGLAALAVISLGLFWAIETRSRAPMFDLGLLRNRTFTGAACAAFATSASLFGMFVYLTAWFQRVQRLDGLHAGLRLLPVTIVAFVAAARSSSRISPRIVLALALSSSTAGLLQMTTLAPTDQWTVILPGLVLCGLGFGLANPTVAAVTLTVAPPDRAATAVGMNSTFRQVGVASGVAALGAVFNTALDRAGHATRVPLIGSHPLPGLQKVFTTGLGRVFVAGAAIAFLGALAAGTLVRRSPGD